LSIDVVLVRRNTFTFPLRDSCFLFLFLQDLVEAVGLESGRSGTGDSNLGEVGNLVDRLAVSLEGPAEDGVLVLGGHLGLGRLSLQFGLQRI